MRSTTSKKDLGENLKPSDWSIILLPNGDIHYKLNRSIDVNKLSLENLLCVPTESYGVIELYVDWLQSHIPQDRFQQVIKRRVIEDFSHKELTELQPGEIYMERVGDIDYVREEAGRWNQVGAETRLAGYRNTKGQIKTIMSYSLLDNSAKVRDNALKLIEVCPNLELKATDGGSLARAILVRKKSARRLCVWSSCTTDPHDVGESHNPASSTYEGFIFEVGNDEKGPLLNIANTIWACYNQIWSDATPVPQVLTSFYHTFGMPIPEILKIRKA